MSKKRKKPGRKDELRNEISQLDFVIGVLGRMRLDATERLRELEAKPKRTRKRLPKCQPHGEHVQAAVRLSDAAPVAAMPLGIH